MLLAVAPDQSSYASDILPGLLVIGFGVGLVLPGVSVTGMSRVLADHPETRERYERVVELIDGFETPYGLELLATTHWVATHEDAATPTSASERVRSWSPRKQHLFTDEHVAIAWQRLEEGGWLAGSRVPVGA